MPERPKKAIPSDAHPRCGVPADLVAEFDRALERCGLQEHRARVAEFAYTACALNLGRKGPGPVGGSRLSGRPDLPSGMEWPKNPRGGRLLPFVAQVNLAELPALDVPVPNSGLLSVFGESGGLTCFLFPTDKLERRQPPAGVPFIGEGPPEGPERRLKHRRIISLPQLGNPLCPFGLDYDDESTALTYDKLDKVLSHRSIGHIGGHPYTVQRDPIGELERYPRHLPEGAPFGRHEWITLIALESQDGVVVAANGTFSVMIPRAYLERGDLSAARSTAEFT